MITGIRLIFVSNDVHDFIQPVDIGSNPHRGLFDAWVDLGNGLAFRIDRLNIFVNLLHEVSQGLNTKVNPLDETGIAIIPQFDVSFSIQSGLLFESGDRVIIKAGPTVFPAFEMCHPIGNIHVNPVNSRGRNLTDLVHVDFAPLSGVGTDPHVFVSLGDPEGSAAAEDSGFACDLSLHPVGMIFEKRVLPFNCMGSDAF